MKQIKTIDGLQVADKRVLLRADLNVPMKEGRVTDSTRLVRSAVTINELCSKGARVIVISHLGRPKGRYDPTFTLKPVAEALAEALGRPVKFAPDCVGSEAERVGNSLENGQVALLENLRFHPGEEMNAAGFAGQLAIQGEAYVNDAFSCSHRAHASIESVARLMPSAAGRLMQSELTALGKALDAPERPVAAVIGGAKISTKMEVLGNLAQKVNLLIIGGAMANTFLHAQGLEVGTSLCERDMAEQAKSIMTAVAERGGEIMLPKDVVVAREFKENAEHETVNVDAIPADAMALDIGARTVGEIINRLGRCKTLVWNGPFGAFETRPFDAGTNAVAQAAARMTMENRLNSVAGGGDTVAALANAGVLNSFSYVSTAGGAFLEWLEGKELPGVAILQEN